MMSRQPGGSNEPAVKIVNGQFPIETRGNTDIIDITQDIQRIVQKSAIQNGIAVVVSPGSTVSITSIEFESGLLTDFKTALDRLLPANLHYAHDDAWHDGNGHAHLRASIIGNSYTVPVLRGKLQLGTYQQIVLIDFDNRARHREVVLQIVGTGS